MHHLDSKPRTRLSTLGALVASLLILLVVGCSEGSLAPESAVVEEAVEHADVQAIRASRVFAGPDQYPPEDFAAYGILAFQSTVTSASRDRYLAICNGFLASLPPATALTERGIPFDQQMATVWPLNESRLADDLNANPAGNRCEEIVDNIDIIGSTQAIALANTASGTVRLDGDGPYLLAWSPSSKFGQADVLVLESDLSNVTNVEQATRRFVDWRTDIQLKPDLWRNGWDLEAVRIVIGEWADRCGAGILRLLGSEAA